MSVRLSAQSRGRRRSSVPEENSGPLQRRLQQRINRTDTMPAEAGPEIRSTVLVVDDDFRFARSIVNELEDRGFESLSANDGNAGLALAIVKNPDLIVLDTRMPCRSGYLVLEHLRSIELSSVPVIMMSENEGNRHRTYASMLGAQEFLAKPLEAHKVADLVVEILENVAANASPSSSASR